MTAIIIGYVLVVIGISSSMWLAFGWIGLSVAMAMIGGVFIFTAPLLDILIWDRPAKPLPKRED